MSELETRLLEFWKADAKIWCIRMGAVYAATGEEPSKIDVAKKRAMDARMVREKGARLLAAATDRRRRPRKIRGTMNVTERSDKLCEPTIECAWCGGRFAAITRGNRAPALYCSPKCKHDAWRVRRALANG